ncbi:hypothetical protein SAMN05216312_11065 [Cohnella sp. OV330]|uniref:hypothetical protein n=1 Tax=Cohnella sp. OV330 TaxID=1855288 RepID=UPI0008ED20EE|nr:hypothetical protein [Cohnella sp. OV330]SFB49338.1 hypothetical protein SAMN05216312_11065 [Cohnella sp. OV330]
MQRLKFMYRFFLVQPLWFRILAPAALLVSILFSSSLFGEDEGYDGGAKLAAAIFFGLWGLQFRRNRRLAIIFFALTALSLYLAVNAFLQEG